MPDDADEDETREVDRDDEEHDSGTAATYTDNEKGQDKEEDCHRIVGKEDGKAPEKGDKVAEPDFGNDGEYLLECYLLCGVDAGDGVRFPANRDHQLWMHARPTSKLHSHRLSLSLSTLHPPTQQE